jgi:uncharacterized protein
MPQVDNLAEFRKGKDSFFKQEGSPIPAEHVADFVGLNYFPENKALRLVLTMDPNVEHETITLQTSTGGTQDYARAGKVAFKVGKERVSLYIYENNNGYFLPFRDGTADNESYEAGRYLEPDTVDDKLLVDFNIAYNPYCAYNEHYSCPIPPRENWTKVRIEAGEKKYH